MNYGWYATLANCKMCGTTHFLAQNEWIFSSGNLKINQFTKCPAKFRQQIRMKCFHVAEKKCTSLRCDRYWLRLEIGHIWWINSILHNNDNSRKKKSKIKWGKSNDLVNCMAHSLCVRNFVLVWFIDYLFHILFCYMFGIWIFHSKFRRSNWTNIHYFV